LTLQGFAHKVKFMLLITGASGLLGWNLCRYFLRQGYDVAGTYHRNRPDLAVQLLPLDLEDEESIERAATAGDWNAVIHAAAMTNPDACEQKERQAFEVNVAATRRLLALVPAAARLIYVSTDLVFDGAKGDYREEDPPNPLNTYARTKLEAECTAFDRPGAIVARAALIYGQPSPFSGGFLAWLAERFKNRETVPLFKDQYRSPLYMGDLCRAIQLLIEREPRHRLYHLGGSQRVSRVEFGETYAELFGRDRRLISPVSFDRSKFAARGEDCSLDSSRFSWEMEFRFRSVREGLMRLRQY
jgi:dTDP-4-dehydrorhamnose reductase